MFLIKAPSFCKEELDYIIHWVFWDIFGLEYKIEREVVKEVSISRPDDPSELRMNADFFSIVDPHWLGAETLPSYREVSIQGIAADVPVLFGTELENREWIKYGSNEIKIGLDILGSLFFLISRYEEVVLEKRDNHDRFSAKHSVVPSEVTANRAVGNEYIELLWKLIATLWPEQKRKQREFRLLPSHDVDNPSYFEAFSRYRQLGSSVKHLATGKSGLSVPLMHIMKSCFGMSVADPYDKISEIMNLSEAVGTRSTFFYIPSKTHQFDGRVNLHSKVVKRQWGEIIERGHDLGIHPGYETYKDPKLMKKICGLFYNSVRSFGLKYRVTQARQHYLRWSCAETPNAYIDAGISVCSNLGYADLAGFRCGVCYEFPMYDLENRKQLDLKQRPLVAMDCSVMDERYEGLGSGLKAKGRLLKLKNVCQKYRGDFTILWHNTRLLDPSEYTLYRSVLLEEKNTD